MFRQYTTRPRGRRRKAQRIARTPRDLHARGCSETDTLMPRSQRNPENSSDTNGFERDPEIDKEMETQIMVANQKEPRKTAKKLEDGRRREPSQET
ncbi:hypothetical protein B0H12DRAFT_1116556 [Mycena haematopus]|nr:hypothetical protein B0H12DRAFT_1116556 [Mycena haematopus]